MYKNQKRRKPKLLKLFFSTFYVTIVLWGGIFPFPVWGMEPIDDLPEKGAASASILRMEEFESDDLDKLRERIVEVTNAQTDPSIVYDNALEQLNLYINRNISTSKDELPTALESLTNLLSQKKSLEADQENLGLKSLRSKFERIIPDIKSLASSLFSIEEEYWDFVQNFNERFCKILSLEFNIDEYATALERLYDFLQLKVFEPYEYLKNLQLCLLPPEELLMHQKHSLELEPPDSQDDPRLKAVHLRIDSIEKVRPILLSAKPLDDSLVAARDGYNSFLKKICVKSLKKRRSLLEKKVRLIQETGERYVISVTRARELIAKDEWDTKRSTGQEGGQNTVVSERGVHFKISSDISGINPAFEWAVYSFARLFLGPRLTPATTTLCFEQIPFWNVRISERSNAEVYHSQNPLTVEEYLNKYPIDNVVLSSVFKSAYIQASRTSGEKSLCEFFDEVRAGTKSLENLDHEFYSGFSILSLVLNFTDAKDDNLRLRGGNKLVSIDNDRVLGNMLAQDTSGNYFVEAKNVLFLMKGWLEKRVHDSIVQKVKNINVDHLFFKWLQACIYQNERYRDFYGKVSLPDGCKPSLIQFQKGAVRQALLRLRTIKKFLECKRDVTHGEVLRELHPHAYDYYTKLSEKYIDPQEAQKALWYSQSLAGESLSVSLADILEKSKDDLSQELPPLPLVGAYEKERREDPIQTTLELLEDYENSSEILKDLEETLTPIKKTVEKDPNHNKKTYSLRDLKSSRKLTRVKRLDLSDGRFSESDLRSLTLLPYLAELILKNNNISIEKIQRLLLLPSLAVLNISQNQNFSFKSQFKDQPEKLVRWLEKSPLKRLIIDPINERITLEPLDREILIKVQQEDGKLALRKIRTNKFVVFGNMPSFDELADLISLLEKDGIKDFQLEKKIDSGTEKETSEQQYRIGLLYTERSAFVESVNTTTIPPFAYQNNSKAFKWFEKATQSNSANGKALYSLGVMYVHGWGVPQDLSKANSYFTQANDHGDSRGMALVTQFHVKTKEKCSVQ